MRKLTEENFEISFRISLCCLVEKCFKWNLQEFGWIVKVANFKPQNIFCYAIAMNVWLLKASPGTLECICHHHVKGILQTCWWRVCRFCFCVHSLWAPRLLTSTVGSVHFILYTKGYCLHLQRSIVIRTCIYAAVFIMDHVMQTILFDSLCPHSGSNQNIVLYLICTCRGI